MKNINEVESDKALKKSEEKFKVLFEQAGFYMLVVQATEDNKLVLVDANKLACEIHGYTREEFLGMSIKDIDKGLSLNKKKLQLYKEQMMAGKSLLFETIHARKDGSLFPVETSISRLDNGKDLPLFISIERDITERKKIDTALKDSEKRFRTLFEQSADAVLIIEGDRFVDCNAATVNMLGYATKEELLKTHPSELSPETQPDGKSSFDKANEMMSIAYKQGSHRFEWNHKRYNGEVFPVEVLLTAVPGKDNYFLHVVWRDITERKNMEAHEKELQIKLMDSERRQSLGVLAGGVAHDLNNILGPIVLLPEMVDDVLEDIGTASKDDIADAREDLKMIADSARRGATVIKDLKSLGQHGHIEMIPVDVNHLVDKCLATYDIETLRERYPHIRIDSKLRYNELIISANKTDLHRVLLNLIVNAFEAIPKRGEIQIEAEPISLPEQKLGYEIIDKGEYVAIHVRNTGEHISDSLLKRIFDPFVTSKKNAGSKSGSGSGLGLSVVHAIVKDHKGYIDVERDLKKWATTFTLYFPFIKNELQQDKQPDTQKNLMSTGANRILIVDDEPGQRFLVRRGLGRLGYEVTEAINGHEAIKILKESPDKQPFDLILLDMIMEEKFDGLDTYQAILELCPEQKVIIASGHAAEMRGKAAQDLGADWLSKPYSLDDLGKAVKTKLEG